MPRLAWGKFHFGDWLNDVELRQCSAATRGIWMDMLCIMHQAEPRGYLKAGPVVIHKDNLWRNLGERPEVIAKAIGELETYNIFSVDSRGCIYCRRMVRDEEIRRKRAEGGKLGGNPALLPPKDNLKGSKKDKPESEGRDGEQSEEEAAGAAGGDGKPKRARVSDLSYPAQLLQIVPDFQERWLQSRKTRKLGRKTSLEAEQAQIDTLAEWATKYGKQEVIDELDRANRGSWQGICFKPPSPGGGKRRGIQASQPTDEEIARRDAILWAETP